MIIELTNEDKAIFDRLIKEAIFRHKGAASVINRVDPYAARVLIEYLIELEAALSMISEDFQEFVYNRIGEMYINVKKEGSRLKQEEVNKSGTRKEAGAKKGGQKKDRSRATNRRAKSTSGIRSKGNKRPAKKITPKG